MNIKKQTLAALAGAILFVGTLIASLFWSFQQIEASLAAANQTHKALASAENVMSTLKDAETGQRGFLLTGDETFLQPYREAKVDLPGQIRTLYQLTRLSASAKHLNALPPLIEEKMEVLQRTIDLRRRQDFAGAQADVARGDGKRLMDAIRAEIDGFTAQEQIEQITRDAKLRATMTTLFAVIAVASLFALLFGMAFVYLIYRQSLQDVKNLVHLETKKLLEVQQHTSQRLQEANATLQISEERLSVTLNSIGDGVIATDVGGCVTLLNPVAEKLTGWTHALAQGQPIAAIFNIINQKTRLPALIPVLDALKTGIAQGLANHTVLIARGGGECDIADSCALIRDRDARAVGAVLVFRDVTDEYAIQNTLRTQQFYNRSLIEANIDAMIATDPSGVITDVNQQMIALTGYLREELIGSSFSSYFAEPLLANVGIANVLRESMISDYELTARARGGHETAVSMNATVFYDSNAVLQGVFATVRDVTEQKRLALLLADKNADLERARESADRANRAKSEFLATMSHEIRTPMNGVIGMIDVLEQSSLNGPQLEMTSIIHDSAFALLAVINDILDFSKIEARKLETETIPLSIANVVESACENMNQMAFKKGVELTLFVDPSIPVSVLGDPGRLRQILINLTNNAIKFSSGKDRVGRVSVRAVMADTLEDRVVVVFQVQDNGIGIDEATRARLFTAFVQADATITRNFGGTGLGLAISNQLVELMGGSISIQSELGKGATFSVGLPFSIVKPSLGVEPPVNVLAALNCLVMVGANGMGRDIAAHLSHAGAVVEQASDLATARRWMASRPAGLGIVIADTVDGDLALDATQRLTNDRSQMDSRFVLIGRGRRRRPRVDANGLVSVDGNLLNGNTLTTTVAIAAGLASAPVREVPPMGTKPAHIPVSRDDARRAGSLILVAEDNEYNQKVILQQLMLLGRTADIARNGQEALKRWQSGDYAILLADLHMPEMDGYELTTAIRKAEAGKDRIPIIAFTANALKGEAEHCLSLGMDDYLSKPVQLDQLKAMLKKWQPVVHSRPVPLSERTADNDPFQAVAPLSVANAEWSLAVDVKVLETLIGSDASVLCEFLADFRATATPITEELRVASIAGQHAAIAALAHKLKSSARAVGALPLGALCESMELSAKATESGELALLWPAFEREFERVDRFLVGYLKMRAEAVAKENV